MNILNLFLLQYNVCTSFNASTKRENPLITPTVSWVFPSLVWYCSPHDLSVPNALVKLKQIIRELMVSSNKGQKNIDSVVHFLSLHFDVISWIPCFGENPSDKVRSISKELSTLTIKRTLFHIFLPWWFTSSKHGLTHVLYWLYVPWVSVLPGT